MRMDVAKVGEAILARRHQEFEQLCENMGVSLGKGLALACLGLRWIIEEIRAMGKQWWLVQYQVVGLPGYCYMMMWHENAELAITAAQEDAQDAGVPPMQVTSVAGMPEPRGYWVCDGPWNERHSRLNGPAATAEEEPPDCPACGEPMDRIMFREGKGGPIPQRTGLHGSLRPPETKAPGERED